MFVPAPRQAPPVVIGPATTRSGGGFTFAERPEVEAPDARIIWRADLDPGALRALAVPIDLGHPDAIDPGSLAPWLAAVRDETGEHAVLSDGWHHIRIDLEQGSLAEGRPVMLRYYLHGLASAEPKILPLRRLLDLLRHRRFSVSLYPPDRRVDRWISALRVHDAVTAGASHREIAQVLFGSDAARMRAGRARCCPGSTAWSPGRGGWQAGGTAF